MQKDFYRKILWDVLLEDGLKEEFEDFDVNQWSFKASEAHKKCPG